MAKYEVTQKQWKSIMGSNPSNFIEDDRPVEQVSWDDCQSFIKALNASASGHTFSLPTEAQWEYACRAGTETPFSFGEEDAYELGRRAWYKQNSGEESHPVGQSLENNWGLHDMHGNVEEWCQDWLGKYDRGSVTNPAGPGAGRTRVKRGGSWFHHPRDCRSANRGDSSPAYTKHVSRPANCRDPKLMRACSITSKT